jgi:hypothetical protein
MAFRNHFNHGNLLKNKSVSDPEIREVYQLYLKFIKNISSLKIDNTNSIGKLVAEFNSYRDAVLYTIENRKNSGQENLRSSMLEELFCHLFSDLINEILPTVPKNLFLGKANSYVDLTFSPSSFREIFIKPNPYIHSKDQDFVLGVSLELKIKADDKTEIKENIIVPILAIECKTYIERNMLDSCSGTARRLKSAMPYCLYIVASEYMKLKDEQPELSDINEIYILCKSSVSERLKTRKQGVKPHSIQEDLIIDLFQKVKGHLSSIWWSPEKSLITGKIINRP